MDDLQFDLGDEWCSMMMNDLDTGVFGEKNELGDDSRFINKPCAQFLWTYFPSPWKSVIMLQ